MFDGDPAISSCVVGFNHVRRTAATPSAHDEHYLVRHSRPRYRVGQIDVLALFHVEIVQELDRLNDDWLTLLVVVHQRMFLTQTRRFVTASTDQINRLAVVQDRGYMQNKTFAKRLQKWLTFYFLRTTR